MTSARDARRLLLFLCVSIVTPLRAQNDLSLHASLGHASAGVQWDVGGELGVKSSESRDAYFPSIGARLRVRRRYSLAVDLQVLEKGFDRTEPTVHSEHLELPLLLLREFTSESSDTHFFLGAGIVPSTMYHCVRFYVGVNGRHEDSCGLSSDGAQSLEAYRHWDISSDYRLGIRQRRGTGRLVAAVRYTKSLIDQQPSDVSAGTSTRHRVVSWTLGYEWAMR